jgi:hypothetical protein
MFLVVLAAIVLQERDNVDVTILPLFFGLNPGLRDSSLTKSVDRLMHLPSVDLEYGGNCGRRCAS